MAVIDYQTQDGVADYGFSGDERRYVGWSPKLDNLIDSPTQLGNTCSGPGEGTNPGCCVRPARKQLGAPAEAEGRPIERRRHGGARQRPLAKRAGALPHPRGNDDLRPCSQRKVRPQDRLLDLPVLVEQQHRQRRSGVPVVGLHTIQRMQRRKVWGEQHEVNHRAVHVDVGPPEEATLSR
jgi:hypothetical protein